ncbi:MAG: glycerol-3-phosphate 1-O-acyltransferase PlsY [Thermodesulfobacteria bacterium]|nr:glycerol-3-phosphate 1-O-acyltransferase PlsY [Thermodesulfobacteriota bacterium]
MKEFFLTYPYVLPVIAYLAGSIPFGLVFSRFKGIDPRSYGSGNIGATNIARGLGKGWGVATLIFDMLKGLIPAYLALKMGLPSFYIALTGLAAVVGHCYSVFLKFSGGKGVATALGVFLALCPEAVGVAVLIFVAAVFYTKYVSVGSLAAAASMPILIFLFRPDSFIETMAWTVCFIIWIRHKDNIARLIKGEEKKISFGSQGT